MICFADTESLVGQNDKLACWGRDLFGEASPPAGSFRSVSAGDFHTCAVKQNDKLACWGYDGDGQTDVPGSLS